MTKENYWEREHESLEAIFDHGHGENPQEYTDAIKLDDEWTGKIIAKIKDLGLYEKTLIYIVEDHGFDEGKSGHGYAPFVFLATNDKNVNRNGTRAARTELSGLPSRM